MDNSPRKVMPWWGVAAAVAAPALLIGGFFAGSALQPVSYSPVRDTISQLAAQGASDPWVMTSAIAGLGLCYLLSALGLQAAGIVSRGLLATGGLATLCIAFFRQPLHGFSLEHELAVIAAALTLCTWPAFALHQSQRARLLTRPASYLAAAILLSLAAWYGLESRGALLGLAERCAAAAPPLWLLAVAITLRREADGVPTAPPPAEPDVSSRQPGAV